MPMQQAQRAATSRDDAPTALPITAWLQAEGRRQPCFVVDISVDGARIHCARAPAAGALAELQLDGGEARAVTVAWRAGNRIGLKFVDSAAAAPRAAD